ncbi:Unknown protein [Striga hermonthica]|uniref:Uncharacterized protein n=1 Tax=Striga hermonthica TaxID=68872 RepID=A0A9N7RNY9_STRHE|nr:Unknown protein [Striga hermonthica]
MPFPLQVLKHELKGLSRIWSKFASGQIATSLGSFNSRGSLTGDFSSSESFFALLIRIALAIKIVWRPAVRTRLQV